MPSSSSKMRYSDLSQPRMQEPINQNNISILKLALLIADFSQNISKSHKKFAQEIQSVVHSFRKQTEEMMNNGLVTQQTIWDAWESTLRETNMSAQVNMNTADQLIQSVYKPLDEIATHKGSQAEKLQLFRDQFENMVENAETKLHKVRIEYQNSCAEFETLPSQMEQLTNRQSLYTAHNNYVLQFRAYNRLIDEFHNILPEILQEFEDIYIDTSNTINSAIQSFAVLYLTKNKDHQRYLESIMKTCRNVNPQSDVSSFVKSVKPVTCSSQYSRYTFDAPIIGECEELPNQLVVNSETEETLRDHKLSLQKEAFELASNIKSNKDVTQSLMNLCQRNLGNHLYEKVYETQEDLCRKRNEIRYASMQLASVKAQVDALISKPNNSSQSDDKMVSATVKGLWKKAFKSLKTNSEKGSLLKRSSSILRRRESKESSPDDSHVDAKDIDPVYSLLKCAADLPRTNKTFSCQSHSRSGTSCQAGTSQTSSPTSSAASWSPNHRKKRLSSRMKSFSLDTPNEPRCTILTEDTKQKSSSFPTNSSTSYQSTTSPKNRRKKLNSRMKSFSLDTPDVPKCLTIDESTKEKSISFTNATPFSHAEQSTSSSLKKKFFSSKRSSSIDVDAFSGVKGISSGSPHHSPKSSVRRPPDQSVYVALYNFRGREKDHLDLRPGCRVTVTNFSDKDWWKGKCNGKVGYFPATYVIRALTSQRVFQLNQSLSINDTKLNLLRLHRDQVVIQTGDEENGKIMIRTATRKESLVPLLYLNEL